ncbi:DUF4241 domain-containing protein [Bacillus safensis]
MTSGHIVACDPFVSEGDQSFTRKVALRKYPILLVVKWLESGDERVAYAMIKFTNEQAIEWELATRAGQDIKHLKEDEFFGYGVNTGMGCFMDAESAIYLQAYEDKRYKEDNGFFFTRNLQKRLSKTTSTHGAGLSPVFMTRWTLPCLRQASVPGSIQAFGGWMKTENPLAL